MIGMSVKEKKDYFLKSYLKPLLKSKGYKTNGLKWRKESENKDFICKIELVCFNQIHYRKRVTMQFYAGIYEPLEFMWKFIPSLGSFDAIHYILEDTDINDFIKEVDTEIQQLFLKLESLKTIQQWDDFLLNNK